MFNAANLLDAPEIRNTGLLHSFLMIEVSKVTARFGNMNKLVPQILEPTIGKKVMPDILITGGGGDNTNSSLSGLLGMKLMEELGGKTPPASTPPSAPQPSFSATPAKPFEPLP